MIATDDFLLVDERGTKRGACSLEHAGYFGVSRLKRIHGNEQRSRVVRCAHEQSRFLRAKILNQLASKPYGECIYTRKRFDVVVRITEGERILHLENAVKDGIAQARSAGRNRTNEFDALIKSSMRSLAQEDDFIRGDAQRVANIVEGIGGLAHTAVDDLVKSAAGADNAKNEQRSESAIGLRHIRGIDTALDKVVSIGVALTDSTSHIKSGKTCRASLVFVEALLHRQGLIVELLALTTDFLVPHALFILSDLAKFAGFPARSNIGALSPLRIKLTPIRSSIGAHNGGYLLLIECFFVLVNALGFVVLRLETGLAITARTGGTGLVAELGITIGLAEIATVSALAFTIELVVTRAVVEFIVALMIEPIIALAIVELVVALLAIEFSAAPIVALVRLLVTFLEVGTAAMIIMAIA